MGILLTNKRFLSCFSYFNKNEIFLTNFPLKIYFDKKKNSLKKNFGKHQVILSRSFKL